MVHANDSPFYMYSFKRFSRSSRPAWAKFQDCSIQRIRIKRYQLKEERVYLKGDSHPYHLQYAFEVGNAKLVRNDSSKEPHEEGRGELNGSPGKKDECLFLVHGQ